MADVKIDVVPACFAMGLACDFCPHEADDDACDDKRVSLGLNPMNKEQRERETHESS